MRNIVTIVFAIVSAVMLLGSGGCAEPCEKLGDELCRFLEDDKACDRTRKDIAFMNAETCDEALEIFEEMLENQ